MISVFDYSSVLCVCIYEWEGLELRSESLAGLKHSAISLQMEHRSAIAILKFLFISMAILLVWFCLKMHF